MSRRGRRSADVLVASYQKLRIWLISARVTEAAPSYACARTAPEAAPRTPYNKTYLIYEDSFLEWVKVTPRDPDDTLYPSPKKYHL